MVVWCGGVRIVISTISQTEVVVWCGGVRIVISTISQTEEWCGVAWWCENSNLNYKSD